jgi:hypothetical protein
VVYFEVVVKLLILDNEAGRVMYRRAKVDFGRRYGSSWNSTQEYWDNFGYANNMRVNIPRWHGQYPVVEALEFNTEADYAWFLLRYS